MLSRKMRCITLLYYYYDIPSDKVAHWTSLFLPTKLDHIGIRYLVKTTDILMSKRTRF